MIEARKLCFSYGNAPVLDNISFSAGEATSVAVLGPNGVGKSTLFKCLLGFLPPSSGDVLINGKSVRECSRRELADFIAYIPQSYNPVFNHTVMDSVLMGITHTLGMFEQPNGSHTEKALACLEELGIENLAERGSLKISGGERQLMLIARALVQNARILIMDEPTANLDYGNSYMVMKKIEELRNKGYTVVFSTHSPDQAMRWADRVLAIRGGEVMADGPVSEALNTGVLKKLYSIDVAVNTVRAGDSEYRVCTPFGE